MRAPVVLVLSGALVAACGFSSKLDNNAPGDAEADASIDAPPANPSVRITQVTSNIAQLRPGLFGFEITIVVQNDLPEPLMAVRGSLAFSDGTVDKGQMFRWRDFDRREGVTAEMSPILAAGAQATFQFKVDALPWAIPPGPVLANGLVTFRTAAGPASATPLTPPLSLPFVTMPAPIVVGEPSDEMDADQDISFREALAAAAANPGIDRIVFDPAAFPTTGTVRTVLDEALGPLPIHTTGDLVIDGRGAGFVLAVDSNWEAPAGRWGFEMSGGSVVISGIRFENMAYNYPIEDLSMADCGSSVPLLDGEGGAIKVTGGSFVLLAASFTDVAVAERNSFQSSLKLTGGTNHRIYDSTWTALAGDAIRAQTPVLEIVGNTMSATANTGRGDDCLLYEGTGADGWMIGNICVDQEFNGLIASSTNVGTLHVIHNTFVRNGLIGNSAVRRSANRAIEMRNNVYVSNNPSAIGIDNGGAGLNIAYEALQANIMCSPACPNATIDMASIMTNANLGLANAAGSTRADMTPGAASPLRDSGTPWVDRNSSRPGWYSNNGPDRGAVEVQVTVEPL